MSVKAVGLGNPLLDISAEVPTSLLEKYGLEPSNAILAEEKHLPLYEELVKDHEVKYFPGGSALNTMCTAQWLLNEDKAFGYLGCVGKDGNAKILLEAAEKEGLRVEFCVDEEKPTGTCAALVTNHKRSLVANLAAAEAFKQSHITSDAATDMLKDAKAIYITSFFLTHSPEAALELAKIGNERNIPVVMNVSAPFLVQVPIFKPRVLQLIERADYVFCNNDEAAALGAAMEWGDDLVEVAKKTAALPKSNTARPRRVIFTHGGDPAIVCSGDDAVERYDVIKLEDGQLVDENGAGDAYVGGFLAGLSSGWEEKKCFAAAAYCAWVVIRRHGATLPAEQEKKDHLGFSFP